MDVLYCNASSPRGVIASEPSADKETVNRSETPCISMKCCERTALFGQGYATEPSEWNGPVRIVRYAEGKQKYNVLSNQSQKQGRYAQRCSCTPCVYVSVNEVTCERSD
uniref:Uncharacterized protein n=1 Tax=Anopheles gambiae TaxID=7165 RepID=A0A903XWW7_ANOGA